MTRIMWAAVLVLAVLTVPVWAQTSQTSSNIVAGQQVAGVRVGGNVNDALTALGSLYNRADSRSGKYSLYEWPLRPFVVIAEKESGRVVLVVVVLNDTYRTDKGSVTGGSERAAVEATYGKEFTTDEDQSSITLIYDTQGIAFDIGKVGVMAGRVTQIVVFTAGQWKAITEGL